MHRIRAHRAETIALSALVAENPQAVLAGRLAPAASRSAPPYLASVAELHHTSDEAGEI